MKHSVRLGCAQTLDAAASMLQRSRRLIDERNAARKAKNFKEADRIRDELKAMGIELEDHKDGTTTWKVSDDGARASEAGAAAVPAGGRADAG